MRATSHVEHAKLEIWWGAIGGGVVVIVCVVILLSLLIAFVRDIARHLLAASQHAERVREHLNSTSLIGDSAGLIHDLGDELELQAAIVARRDGGAA